MVEGPIELVDGVGPERVADLRPVERDTNRAGRLRPVVGDVGEVEAGHDLPGIRIEGLGHSFIVGHGRHANRQLVGAVDLWLAALRDVAMPRPA